MPKSYSNNFCAFSQVAQKFSEDRERGETAALLAKVDAKKEVEVRCTLLVNLNLIQADIAG